MGNEMARRIGRHVVGEHPRVLVVDGSRMVRALLGKVLATELEGVDVVACATGAEALAALADEVVDFVTVALRLPDMDGLELVHAIRTRIAQAYVPIVVVSGDVDARLGARTLGDEVTDYVDKSLGFQALADFIRGYVSPGGAVEGQVLYVEDSRVVALATRRMMEKHGLDVIHVVSVEDALAWLETARAGGKPMADVILTDVTLKGELTGGDLVRRVRKDFGLGQSRLPVLVMTGDDNLERQAALIHAGANDLVEKPIDESALITKLRFQLRVARHVRKADHA